MSRLRQLRPYEYGSSTAVHTEFENLVRYLQTAEVGGQSLAETIAKLTDDDGNLSSSVQLRNVADTGIQYRVGEYTDAEAGWTTVIAAADLRGPSGSTVGEVGAPIFNSRVDFQVVSNPSAGDDTELAAGATTLNYSHVATDTLLVYRQGVLLRPTADYTTDAEGNSGSGTITLSGNQPATVVGNTFSVYKIRATAITDFTRQDYENTFTGDITLVPFTLTNGNFTDSTQLVVYKNGILLREPEDYSRDVGNQRIQLVYDQRLAQNDILTVLTVENSETQTVSGFMMETTYTDGTNGLINFNKIAVADAEITQSKVQNLTTDLSARARFYDTPATSTFSALGPDFFYKRLVGGRTQVLFYDGSNEIQLNPDTSLPSSTTTDVGKFVKVDAAGGYTLGSVDLSNYLDNDDKGASNGVAQLDAAGDIVFSQYAFSGTNSLLAGFTGGPAVEHHTSGSVSNDTYRVQRFFGSNFKITGIELRCGAGSGNVQLLKNGANVGSAYAVDITSNSGVTTVDLGTSFIGMDARVASLLLSYEVTSATNLADLEVVIKTELVENA